VIRRKYDLDPVKASGYSLMGLSHDPLWARRMLDAADDGSDRTCDLSLRQHRTTRNENRRAYCAGFDPACPDDYTPKAAGLRGGKLEITGSLPARFGCSMDNDCRIRVLPDLLVNKIAAGEVVERPASVVKELVENALDAGATRVSVAIEEGGRQLVRVTDDGCGMSAEELRLAAQPHATSKIVVEDDLYSIATMGFRGEALASISAVSKLRMVSRRADSVEGFEVRIAGERLESGQAAGCPVGTTVEVRDLFFNVPARRKFLRAPSTEMGHVGEQLSRLALAHSPVAFQWTHNGRMAQNLPACDSRLERIARFYGQELASALLRVQRSERGLALEAYLAPPSQSRATQQWQYTYVNGRYIRDRFLQHAIREAYRGLMEPNRHGVVFLFLVADPREVDVNVHPTKIEVRWADANMVHSQVLSALRETFQRCDLVAPLLTQRAAPSISAEEQDRLRQELASVMKAAAPIQPAWAAPGTVGAEFPWPGSPSSHTNPAPGPPAGPRWAGDHSPPAPPQQMGDIWRSLYGPPHTAASAGPPELDSQTHGPTAGAVSLDGGWQGPRPRAIQMHNLYLVAETDDGIVIVDQHALHERVMYEQLRQRLTLGPLEAQRLLLPETLRVTPQHAALLESHAELLHQLGIDVSPFGTDTVAVHTFPALLKDTDVVGLMRDLLDELAQRAGSTSTEIVIHRMLDMMACKAAVKAGDRLTEAEIDALIAQRHLIEKPTSCPHGRPTMLRLTKADLNRQFKRT